MSLNDICWHSSSVNFIYVIIEINCVSHSHILKCARYLIHTKNSCDTVLIFVYLNQIYSLSFNYVLKYYVKLLNEYLYEKDNGFFFIIAFFHIQYKNLWDGVRAQWSLMLVFIFSQTCFVLRPQRGLGKTFNFSFILRYAISLVMYFPKQSQSNDEYSGQNSLCPYHQNPKILFMPCFCGIFATEKLAAMVN